MPPMPPMPLCREALANGSCTQVYCLRIHERQCKICDKFILPFQWEKHVKGISHRDNVRSQDDPQTSSVGTSRTTTGASLRGGPTQPPVHKRPVRCDACGIYVANISAYDDHRTSQKHQEAFTELVEGVTTNAPGATRDRTKAPLPGHIHCGPCNEDVPEAYWNSHERLKRHLKRKAAADVEASFAGAPNDTQGITVTSIGEIGDVDFDFIDTYNPSEFGTITQRIEIVKEASKGRITLKTPIRLSFIINDLSEESFSARLVGKKRREIKYREPRFVEVNFTPICAGLHQAFMELQFNNIEDGTEFSICRTLRATVGVVEVHDALKPTTPFQGVPRLPPPPPLPETIHPGRMPVKGYGESGSRRQKENKPPSDLIKAAFEPHDPDPYENIKDRYIPKQFNKVTHGRFFRTCLYIEEEQTSRDLDRFSKNGVLIQSDREFFKLEIEGLAEKRPSVLIGDTILAQVHETPGSLWYQGVVHKVQSTQVLLRFHEDFIGLFIDGMRFNVRFTLNKTPFWRYHNALLDGSNFLAERLLFPDTYRFPKSEGPRTMELVLYDRKIQSNEMQKEAIRGICSQPPGSGPFVVWGPPGTGKTVTMVETIHQLLLKNSACRILACAPSNAAADLLATRLDLQPNVLFRLCSVSRDVKSLPAKLQDNVLINSEGSFAVPPLEELEKYHVVVSTCVSAGLLQRVKLRRGHFSYIFVDEAGQAHEPEALVPIKALADDYTNIVLSGDPKQLPPIIRSPLVLKLGLGKSYLERMVELWKKEQNNSGVTVILLQDHFRSHPDIIDFPNRKFYENKLRYCADPAITQSMRTFSGLPNPKFPIIFHAVRGKDDREGYSPSFFNLHEASLVKVYVESLLGRENQKLRLTHEHIGVISPYQAQCAKVHFMLKNNTKASGIKVGSVEEFQGQERRVIIVSTVRSTLDFVGYDLRHHLGFVADPKRFNVAVTRAQALLIVIGDPHILSLDPLWKTFLNYVYLKGGWTGKNISWDPRGPVNGAASKTGLPVTALDELIQRTKNNINRRLNGEYITHEDTGGGQYGWHNGAEDGQADRVWRVLD